MAVGASSLLEYAEKSHLPSLHNSVQLVYVWERFADGYKRRIISHT
jgi:hypothetical protein